MTRSSNHKLSLHRPTPNSSLITTIPWFFPTDPILVVFRCIPILLVLDSVLSIPVLQFWTSTTSDHITVLLELRNSTLSSQKPKRKLLYDWRFTTNQFVLMSSPLRPTARDFINIILAVIVLM
jgi:hypothetical protein